MQIIRFVIGTIVSIIALAVATKLAAFILGLAFTVVAIVFFLLKVALIVGIAMFLFWAISRIMQSSRRGESL